MRLTRLAILFLGLLGGLALAQTPTPAQLELLKNMPAEQREALMKQYGVDPSIVGDVGVSSQGAGQALEPGAERGAFGEANQGRARGRCSGADAAAE